MADPEYDGLSLVVVEAVTADIDGNIQPGNIKKGVTILGVTGTLAETSDWYSILIVGESGFLTQAEVGNLADKDHTYVIYLDSDKKRYISCLSRTKTDSYLSFGGVDGTEYFSVTINRADNSYIVTKTTTVTEITDKSTDTEIPTAQAVNKFVNKQVNNAVSSITSKYYTKAFTKADFTQVGEEARYVIAIPKSEHNLTNAIVLKMTLEDDTSTTCIYEDKTLSTGTVKIYVTVDLPQLLQYNGKIYLKGE